MVIDPEQIADGLLTDTAWPLELRLLDDAGNEVMRASYVTYERVIYYQRSDGKQIRLVVKKEVLDKPH